MNAVPSYSCDSVRSAHSIEVQPDAFNALSINKRINVMAAIVKVPQVGTTTVPVISLFRPSTPLVSGRVSLDSLRAVVCSEVVSNDEHILSFSSS